MVTDSLLPPAINYLQQSFPKAGNIRLGILRLDALHPEISGNKWFKLKENIRLAKEMGHDKLLTFGGAYSNHLAATAAAAAQAGLGSVAIVRGWHGSVAASPTLNFCARQGMQLHFVSKTEYDLKYNEDYLENTRKTFGRPFIIPEGGNNEAGRDGCGQIAAYIPPDADHVAVAIGTGTTFCGIRKILNPTIRLHGFPVMKNGGYLAETIRAYVPPGNNWHLHTGYHFGGFAKHTEELISFMNDFYSRHAIRLDFVYTAKLLSGIYDMIRKGTFRDGTHIICIHTGGLQGNASLQHKLCF